MIHRSRLVALLLLVFVGVFAFCPKPAAAATAPTKTWIAPSESNNIPSQIDVWAAKSGNTTVYQYYLPGNANVAACYLSWDGDMQFAVDGVVYESGTCPIPPVGQQKTYTLMSEGKAVTTFQLISYQGSASVTAVFIEIDETGGKPTISQMDSDRDHDTTCSGIIYIDGTQYELSKMKGRGNVTWNQSKDKKPYNITLGKKIKWPGLDSEKTKKWSLLSEPFDKSLLGTRSAFDLAYDMGIGQDTVSADVWMNGEYQGCYTVTPKTDSFVTDDGFMLENDNYIEDPIEQGGDPQFYLKGSNAGNKNGQGPLMTVKKIGDNLLTNSAGEVDESAANLRAVTSKIQSWLQEAWDAILSDTGYNSKGKYYTDYIDVESFAKMYLMHEYVKSFDVLAGSILFYANGTGEGEKLYAGPIWDVDNALGATQQNSGLGTCDDRRNGDRRSGEGDWFDNILDSKTCIMKSLSKHSDFMLEVYRQYNIYRDDFDSVAFDLDQMTADIAASAKMNHVKVQNVMDNHTFNGNLTLGSGQYRQTYVSTSGDTTVWENYVKNLRTFVSTRSLWFSNNYNIVYYGTELDGWAVCGGKRYYYLEGGSPMAEGWASFGDSWYYFRNYSLVQSGWVAYGDSYCYLQNYVALEEGWVSYAGKYYYIKDYVPMQEGWATYAGKYYFVRDYTTVKEGWVSYEEQWYYIRDYNPMKEGWVSSGGQYYYIKDYVPMEEGWATYNGQYFYLRDYHPVTNTWVTYEGKRYHFNAKGVCDGSAAA